MPLVNVKSEVRPLSQVILHRPGNELLNLTPNTLEELLFDDIPFLRVAQEEHDAFAKALEDNGVEVLYLEKLVADVFDENQDLRSNFLETWVLEAGVHSDYYKNAIFEYMNSEFKDTLEFVLKTMEGVNIDELDVDLSHSLRAYVIEKSTLIVPPMPNLYFTRDNFAMIGNGVSINHMYSATRNRETIYGDYIFSHHPTYKDVPRYYDRKYPFSIEGGDILNISETCLAVGISQRTEADGIQLLAENIFASDSPIDTILAFEIPNNRSMMHLDTVFTQIDYDKFVVHPGILAPLTVYELSKKGKGIRVTEETMSLKKILKKHVGCKVELIKCGGGNRIVAEREQWNDGSNTLCISPGKVVVYERNDVTNAILEEKGIEVVQIPSAELSRGRGGPRCMSMPAWRED